jgi:hypothetical protein
MESVTAKTITERVHYAFPSDQPPDYVPDFMEALRGTMKDIADATRRAVLSGLLVAAMFELINEALITGLQVGPFRIERLAIIQKVLPIFYGYFAYDAAVQILQYQYCWVAYLELMSISHGSVRAMGLDRLLLPRTSSLFGPLLFNTGSRLFPIVHLLTVAIRAAAVVLGAGVGCYMLYRLFMVFGAHDILTWISTVISIGFAAYGLVVYLFALSQPRQSVGG